MFSHRLTATAELRPLEVWNADDFAAHLDRAREHIRPWVSQAFVTEGVEDARKTLARFAERAANDGGRLFGIWSEDVLVGGVMFTNYDAANGSCELGCWLEPSAEGHGLITAACGVLVDEAFRVRGLHRIEWHCRGDNERSAAVARRLGMRLEGVHRESWKYDGVYYDNQVWAVLSTD